jgi:hypothetical protein
LHHLHTYKQPLHIHISTVYTHYHTTYTPLYTQQQYHTLCHHNFILSLSFFLYFFSNHLSLYLFKQVVRGLRNI